MAHTRGQYLHWIRMYEKRRLKYTIQKENASRKIKLWKRQIKRMDDKVIQITAIGNHVAYFTGVNVKGCAGSKAKNVTVAKGIFYKYCLENEINGNVLRQYTGDASKNSPGRIRREFTASFASSPENKDLWERWKLYITDMKDSTKTSTEKY